MAAIGVSEFESALRGLSREEFARFVAELWAARGFETAVEEGVVVVRGDGSRRLGVRHDARRFARLPGLRSTPANGDVDAVVSSGVDPPAGPDSDSTIDAADLREMALYAVDRPDCEALFRRHLDRPPEAPDGAGSRGLPAGLAVGSAAAVVVAVLLLVGAGGVGPAATTADAGANPPGSEPDVVTATLSGVGGGAAGTGNGTAGAEASGAVTPRAGNDTPGVDASGITSPAGVARAHARTVRARPHSWSITFRRTHNGSRLKHRRQTVWVHNATVYRSRTEWAADTRADTSFRGNASTYADGSRAFRRVREGNATIYRRLPVDDGPPSFADQPAVLFRRFLAANETRAVSPTAVDGTVAYRIVLRGRIHSNTTPVRTTAVVTRSGVVRRLEARYRTIGGRTAHVSFRLHALGNVTVSDPPWVERARAATAG